jgi:hypothetical protein
MNCCSETTKMGVPPGNRPAVPRDWSEAYPYGTSQGEPVLSLSKEHPRTPGFRLVEKDGHIRGRSKLLMKYPC